MSKSEKDLFCDIFNFVYETVSSKCVPDCGAILTASIKLFAFTQAQQAQQKILDAYELDEISI